MSGGRSALAALVCLTAFVSLGAFVAPRPPGYLDLAGLALRGNALPFAVFFTTLGRWYAVAAIGIAALVAAIVLHADVRPVLGVCVSQLASQTVVAVVKPIFARIRPPDPLIFRETDFSFPSGHAATAIVFFVGLALVIARSPAVPRPWSTVAIVVLAAAAIGIPWSRTALGAHWTTDVFGGLLFGAGWLFATLAIARVRPFM